MKFPSSQCSVSTEDSWHLGGTIPYRTAPSLGTAGHWASPSPDEVSGAATQVETPWEGESDHNALNADVSERIHHVCFTVKLAWIFGESTNNTRIHKSTMAQGASPDAEGKLLQVRLGQQSATDSSLSVNPRKEGGSPCPTHQAFFSKSLSSERPSHPRYLTRVPLCPSPSPWPTYLLWWFTFLPLSLLYISIS